MKALDDDDEAFHGTLHCGVRGGWDHPPNSQYPLIRSKAYLATRLKETSEEPLFTLVKVQMIHHETPIKHVALHAWSMLPQNARVNEWLILNFMIPGTFNVQIISYYIASDQIKSVLHKGENVPANYPWEVTLREFWKADKTYCDNRFKLIPTLIKVPWAVKAAVSTRPCLSGKRITQNYFRGDQYFEIDIDISSSSLASGILRLVRSCCRDVVIDLAVVIQGEAADELPERLLCQCRYINVDFADAKSLPLQPPVADEA